MEPDLSIRIGNIRMKNPIMPASGTAGYGKEMADIIDISELGAFVMKTTTLKPRQGNPTPRICETDAEVNPEMLTVMCCAGIDGMNAVQKVVGEKTEVLGVTVLTSLNEEECQAIFTCSTKAGVLRFARMTKLAGLGSLILSPKEVEVVKDRFELMLSLNTPGVRPEWSIVSGDDQARILTPYKAKKNGAKRIVMGRPITQAKVNNDGLPQNPREAVERTLKEIGYALEEEGDD